MKKDPVHQGYIATSLNFLHTKILLEITEGDADPLQAMAILTKGESVRLRLQLERLEKKIRPEGELGR